MSLKKTHQLCLYLKAYETYDVQLFGHLYMPGIDFILFVHQMDNCVVKHYKTLAISDFLGQKIFNLFPKIKFSPPWDQYLVLYGYEAFL